MPWRLDLTRRAERDLSQMARGDRDAVERTLDRLTREFGSLNVKKMAGRPGQWCLRIGRWRAILRLDNQAGSITVLRVVPRGMAYRD